MSSYTPTDVFLSFVKFLKSEISSVTVEAVLYNRKSTSSDLIKSDCINAFLLTDEFDDTAYATDKRIITVGIHVASGEDVMCLEWLAKLTDALNIGRAQLYHFDSTNRSGTIQPSRFLSWDERLATRYYRAESANIRRFFTEFDIRYTLV